MILNEKPQKSEGQKSESPISEILDVCADIHDCWLNWQQGLRSEASVAFMHALKLTSDKLLNDKIIIRTDTMIIVSSVENLGKGGFMPCPNGLILCGNTQFAVLQALIEARTNDMLDESMFMQLIGDMTEWMLQHTTK